MAGRSRIYFDLCALKRAYDDQRSPRVRLEAEAVTSLLERRKVGGLEAISSAALTAENRLDPSPARRERTDVLLASLTRAHDPELLPEGVEKAEGDLPSDWQFT